MPDLAPGEAIGRDGRHYVTFGLAHERTLLTRAQLEKRVDANRIASATANLMAEVRPAVTGTPVQKYLLRDDVESLRASILAGYGVIEPVDPPNVELIQRCDKLEAENAELRGENESLKQQVWLSLEIDTARLAQLREHFIPHTPAG